VLPGGVAIAKRYRNFREELPTILEKDAIDASGMVFADYTNLASTWLLEPPRSPGGAVKVAQRRPPATPAAQAAEIWVSLAKPPCRRGAT